SPALPGAGRSANCLSGRPPAHQTARGSAADEKRTLFMTRILTVECYGDLPAGWVPCISWPLPELADGKVENAPVLVPIGPQQWELRVAVRGAAADSCLTACVPGMRPLQFPDFNLGCGYQRLPPRVRWTYTLGPVLLSATTDIYYY